MATKQVNYDSLLSNDQQLQASLADILAQRTNDQNQLTENRQRALIQYGGVPSAESLNSLSTGNVAGDITALTRQRAQEFTQGGGSTIAGLAHNYHLNQSATVGDLAARGLLNSSALNQHMGENLYNYNLASAGASQQLTDYLAGLQSGYVEHQRSLTGDAVTATTDATKRITDMINAGLIAGPGTAPTGTNPTSAGVTPGARYVPPGYANATGYDPHPSFLPGGAPTATAYDLHPSFLPGGAPTATAQLGTTSNTPPRNLGSAYTVPQSVAAPAHPAVKPPSVPTVPPAQPAAPKYRSSSI